LEDENTDTTSQTSNGGVPGVATNTGAETNNPTTNPLTSTKQRKKTTNSEYEVSRTTSNLTQLAGGVKRLSAAVFVAARMEGTGAARKVAPRSQDELEKLRRIVQSSVGIQQNDPTRKDEITLEEMPFNDQIGEVGNNLEDDQKKEFWWQQVQNLIYPVLALGVFGFFWRLLKRTAAEELPAEPDRASAKARFAPGRVPAGVETAGGAAPEEGRETALSGVISPEAFNKLVRENPANFGQAIQVWLARGSPGNLDQS
jgi:flagellar biosynthesis/type III secretory pathway M-ring protein FliF/YscJ